MNPIKCLNPECNRLATSPLTKGYCIICYSKVKNGLIPQAPIEQGEKLNPYLEILKFKLISNSKELIPSEEIQSKVTPEVFKELEELNNIEEEYPIGPLMEYKEAVLEASKVNKVSLNNPTAQPCHEIKFCQSCIERGISQIQPATHLWADSYYICDLCYEPLINNLLGWPNNFIPFEDISSTTILESHEQFYNHHAQAIVNKTQEEVEALLEHNKKVIFTLRRYAEVEQDYINKCKVKARAALRLQDEKYDSTRPSDSTTSAKIKLVTQGEKIKLTKEEKLLQSMASAMVKAETGFKPGSLQYAEALTAKIKMLQNLGQTARKTELSNIIGV